MLHCCYHCGGGATASKDDNPRPGRFSSKQSPGGRVKTTDVCVVPVEPVGFEPERVHCPHSLSDLGELVAAGMNGDFVRNGDITRNPEILQLFEQRTEIAGGDIHRLIQQRDAGCAESGILKDRRE